MVPPESCPLGFVVILCSLGPRVASLCSHIVSIQVPFFLKDSSLVEMGPPCCPDLNLTIPSTPHHRAPSHPGVLVLLMVGTVWSVTTPSCLYFLTMLLMSIFLTMTVQPLMGNRTLIS